MEPAINAQINQSNSENLSATDNHKEKDLCPVHESELTNGFCEYCQVCYSCK